MGKSVILVARLVAFVCLVGALIILLMSSQYSDNESLFYTEVQLETKFTDFRVYIYMLGCIGVGIAYNLFQTVLPLSIGVSLLDLFGDMIIANILVSGAAATFGFTLELSRVADLEPTSFFNKIFISAGLSLLATLFTLISLISSHVALKAPAN
ncbi:CASP-like protein 4D1 [Nicotiana tomentosiformis]|uniref:CASP-like protein 4D1 n=1 Tax=Nicotiana tomentosiformis TaxID=4098 RepID=UPI00051C1D92|nr:CASP-like protein 4D1 [Nicotiana tomentosiformis]